jgi:phosphoribosylanthranilate isomerase
LIFAPPSQILPEPARVRVKVCGLTCAADADLAVALGADALGLNFYPPSPRCLDAEKDADWIHALPPGTQKIAVLVNPTRGQIDLLLENRLADAVQLHGDESEDFCRDLQAAGIPFIKAIRVRDASALLRPERFHTDCLLLDAYQPHAFGGTGHQVDWELAARFAAEQAAAGRQVILSGGLVPENVAEAIRRVRPAGVDVASGVEGAAGPRRKDEMRLRAFFEAIRGATESM